MIGTGLSSICIMNCHKICPNRFHSHPLSVDDNTEVERSWVSFLSSYRWEVAEAGLLLLNLYAGQETTVRTRHGTTDWFQIGKGVRQGCILSPYLAEYIMRNAGLDVVQAGIKIAGRNINNLRYADDTTLMAESEEELKSLLIKVKEESEKVCLKFNIQKTKIMASGLITSWQIDGKTMETVTRLFFWLQNH